MEKFSEPIPPLFPPRLMCETRKGITSSVTERPYEDKKNIFSLSFSHVGS